MPVFIRPRSEVCLERAKNDATFYYESFKELLIDNSSEELTTESRQNVIRLDKWISKYIKFAYSYHLENFVRSDDLYLDKQTASKFSYMTDIPKAPFIDVFDEIDGF